ncbi:MAG TPA: hypothetical protein VFZ79_08675 [Acidimicrobiales bacterium]
MANVLWCTGFAPDLTWIKLPIFNDDGDPVHHRGVVESEPGLYFIGMYFLYALSSVLIGGSEGTPSMSPGTLRRANRPGVRMRVGA